MNRYKMNALLVGGLVAGSLTGSAVPARADWDWHRWWGHERRDELRNVVEKFKTIEKNFAMIVVNCAGTDVSLDKIYATGPGAARSSRTAANWRTTGRSFKGTKEN
jgi:hypothetical protein